MRLRSEGYVCGGGLCCSRLRSSHCSRLGHLGLGLAARSCRLVAHEICIEVVHRGLHIGLLLSPLLGLVVLLTDDFAFLRYARRLASGLRRRGEGLQVFDELRNGLLRNANVARVLSPLVLDVDAVGDEGEVELPLGRTQRLLVPLGLRGSLATLLATTSDHFPDAV